MNRCKIVVYHYVRPIKSSQYDIKGMDVDDFQNQIIMLKKKYKPIKMQDIIEALDNKRQITNDSVLLTFDDGIKDHYEYVFPLLRENNIEGLFFPSGKPILEKIVLDVHKIQFILASVKNPDSIISEIKKSLDDLKKEFDIELFDSYYKKFAVESRFDSKDVRFIKNLLQKGLPHELRTKLIDHLFKRYVTNDEESFSKKLYLSLDEIGKMKNAGMTFGSHSYSHYWLSTLTERELTKELDDNLGFLEKIRGDYLGMCYPHGSYNDLVIQKMDEYSFQFGLTTEVGEAILDNENRFKLKRFDCNDSEFL
ncbi:MAG: polysaccharide deacetylase [Thaumarchaeota archaeon]|nr:polysaccharide deacetylase [Nitrososphaerota archaeon]